MSDDLKLFTPEELACFDGRDGRPVYVAVCGVVYDLTGSKIWKSGRHMNRHDAGMDLSTDLNQAPHGLDRLERYPRVGLLAGAAAAAPGESGLASQATASTDAASVQGMESASGDTAGSGASGGVSGQARATTTSPRASAGQTASGSPAAPKAPARELPWLLRKNPFLRRHPHPMTVHFPIAFATGAALFLAAWLLTGSPLCEQAVHAMNIAGALFTPVAILTGLATWKYNYGSCLLWPIRIKLALSPVLLLQFTACVVWWLADPGVLAKGGREFPLLVVSMLPTMGLVGWFGAGLTFPMHD